MDALSPRSRLRTSLFFRMFPASRNQYGYTLCKSLHNVGYVNEYVI